jgi:hypothetical protein
MIIQRAEHASWIQKISRESYSPLFTLLVFRDRADTVSTG